jgi:hypothetical protein
MAYAIVRSQAAVNSASGSSLGTTLTGAWGAGNAAGVFGHDGNNDTTWPTCADDRGAGNTYTERTGARCSDADDNNKLTGFTAKNLAGSGNPTVTLSWGTARGFRAILVIEVSGIDTTAEFINAAGQHQFHPGTTSDAISSGNVNFTSQPAAQLAVSFEDHTGSSVPATGTGYTNINTFSDGTFAFRWEHKRVTATGNSAGTFTDATNGSVDDYNTSSLGLAEASGAAAVTYPQLERGIRGLERGVAMGSY